MQLVNWLRKHVRSIIISECRPLAVFATSDSVVTARQLSTQPYEEQWLLYIPSPVTHKHSVLSTQCIYMLSMILTVNSDYSPLIGWSLLW